MRLAVVAAIVVLAAALPARAQVAVATAIAVDDVTQRQLASDVLAQARKRWEVLEPQIEPEQVKACSGNAQCLLDIARKREASHLLVVGAARLGVRDYVVSVKLFDVNKPEPLFKDNDVQPGAQNDGRAVKALTARLLETDGPPPALASSPPPPEEPAATPAAEAPLTGPLMLAGGAAVLGLTYAVSFPAAPGEPEIANAVLIGGSVTGLALALVGGAIVVIDAL